MPSSDLLPVLWTPRKARGCASPAGVIGVPTSLVDSEQHIAVTAEGRQGRGTLRRMGELLRRITVDPRVCGGQPCVRGIRIPVSLVLRHLAAGQSAEQVIAEYPELKVEDLRECLRYAA